MSSVVISGDTSGAVTISAPAVAGTTTLTLPATSGTILQSGTTVTEAQGGTGTSTGYYGFKNRIINGAMVIDQRNAGAVTTPTNTVYTLDRWRSLLTQASKYTVQQNAGAVTPPAGFRSYLGITSSASAYSVISTDYFVQQQFIEGYNFADFAFGTASASTITISFWVRSSLTGTFGGSVFNNDGSRCYAFTYTISVANTWEYKTVTIAGDTTGTWNTTSSTGLAINFGLGVGSSNSISAGAWSGTFGYSATGATSVVGTANATFYVTGVQLEKGSTATSFDYRPYGTELALCQRYYFKFSAVSSTSYFTTGWAEATTIANGVINFPVQLRTNPTALEQSGTATDYRVVDLASAFACNAVPAFVGSQSSNTALVRFAVASGLTAGRCVGFSANSSTAAFLAWSAEL